MLGAALRFAVEAWAEYSFSSFPPFEQSYSCGAHRELQFPLLVQKAVGLADCPERDLRAAYVSHEDEDVWDGPMTLPPKSFVGSRPVIGKDQAAALCCALANTASDSSTIRRTRSVDSSRRGRANVEPVVLELNKASGGVFRPP